MKLLIINYLFPPAGGIAVQRALSLAKYLPQFGFEVHVLSAGNAAAPVQNPGYSSMCRLRLRCITRLPRSCRSRSSRNCGE